MENNTFINSCLTHRIRRKSPLADNRRIGWLQHVWIVGTVLALFFLETIVCFIIPIQQYSTTIIRKSVTKQFHQPYRGVRILPSPLFRIHHHHQQQQQQPQGIIIYRRRSSIIQCNLFVRKPTTDEKAKIEDVHPKGIVTDSVRQDLISSNITFPYIINYNHGNKTTSKQYILRIVEANDIDKIATICTKEYGTGPDHFPVDITNLQLLSDWIEKQQLRLLVDWTTRLKVPPPTTTTTTNTKTIPSDHAFIVLTTKNTDNNDEEDIIGMIEVSLQPVIPNYNPSPFPIPVLLKQLYCILTNTPLEGWITNLLIVPNYRGKGYSPLLALACEGIVKSWNKSTIHLHCDPDITNGARIAQNLYTKNLGYIPGNNRTKTKDGRNLLTRQEQQYSWLMNNIPSSDSSLQDYEVLFNMDSIVFVDDVPLLYLRKDL